MKKALMLLLGVFVLMASAWAQNGAQVIKDIVPLVQSWSTNPQLVAAVRSHNASKLSIEQILSHEKTWSTLSTNAAQVQALMTNDAAEELKKLQQSRPFFTELILMDQQGALVAMTHRTSDYWQGDEEKFTETYPKGTQALHKSAPVYDASVGGYVVQVSVPVIDQAENIGALTVSIKLNAVHRTQ